MKKIAKKTLATLNVLVIIGMMLTGFADILDPRTWGFLAIAGYAFPFFAFLNVVFIVVWMIVSKRYILLPFAGFILCYSPVMKFCPLNIGQEAPIGCLKVMTFNTWQFGYSEYEATDEERAQARRDVLNYIADADCDIVCLQESGISSWMEQEFDSIVKPVMPYRSSSEWCGNSILLLSKYPIVRHEKIKYESKGNLSVAFFLNVNGKELIVVNNHLESNHFSTEEKEHFGDVVKGGAKNGGIKGESKFVARKLVNAAKIRAAQADAVATFVSLHKGRSIILCGDFNDIPLSYAHRTIAKDLTDCYISTAKGPGFSYHRNGMYVRIDNMMCSNDMTPFDCHVDKSCSRSDHFPIVGWIKWKK